MTCSVCQQKKRGRMCSCTVCGNPVCKDCMNADTVCLDCVEKENAWRARTRAAKEEDEEN